jgi:predicted nucleotidyltransferase
MRRDDVIAKLKETEPVLRDFGVAALYLFGSHARDEASPDSDVDVFIDVAPGAAFGLRPYMGPFARLKTPSSTKRKSAYSTRDGLSPYIRADVERDALRIF